MAPRALFIEDDKSVQHILSTILRAKGLQIDTACDQREIYDHLSEADDNATPYDVIILDEKLKTGHNEITGLEIYKIIRLESGLKQVPIIAGSQDVCSWQGTRLRYDDTNLHTVLKINRHGTNYWDDVHTVEILSRLNFLQKEAAPL